MSIWFSQSFNVDKPRERLNDLRKQLKVEDRLVVMNTRPTDEDEQVTDDVDYEVLALTAFGLRQPSMDSYYDIRTDEETIFGPYMDLILEPGEYGCVLGINDTACGGEGHVYQKTKSGEIEIIGPVADDGEIQWGEGAARECARKYGFRPSTHQKWDLTTAAEEQGDPYYKYHDLIDIEENLSGVTAPNGTADSCPDCGSSNIEEDHEIGGWATTWECEECYDWQTKTFKIYHESHLTTAGGCWNCGGDLAKHDLQYPGIGSTAFECQECGEVTFDTADLPDEELNPDTIREDAVGPDSEAYREKHGIEDTN